MTTYADGIKSQMRASRRLQAQKEAEFKLAKEIIYAEDLTPDEKYIRLISECGYGSERAQQIIYDRIKFPKKTYQNKEEEK